VFASSNLAPSAALKCPLVPRGVQLLANLGGVAAFAKRTSRGKPSVCTPAKDRLLGTMPDGDVARKLRRSAMFFEGKRFKISAFRA
jgi:hypothetical protein